MASEEELKSLKTLVEDAKVFEKKLKRLQGNQKRQQKNRDHKKRVMNDLRENEPELYAKISKSPVLLPGTREKPGQPNIEFRQPLLLKTIVDIISPEAGTDPKRRSEMLRTCRTLDELHENLKTFGIKYILKVLIQ